MGRELKILVNASTVKIAGGLSVALNFLQAVNNVNTSHKFIVLAPSGVGYEKYDSNFVKIITVPNIILLRPFRIFLDRFYIQKQIKENNPDVVFSMGNLPTVTNRKQALLFDNPFTSIAKFDNLGLSSKEIFVHKLRNIFFKRRLKYVDLLIAQTDIQKDKIIDLFTDGLNVSVVENAHTIIPERKIPSDKYSFGDNKKVLLCLSRYYSHKNIEVLVSLAEVFKRQNKNFKIVLTIEKDTSDKAKRILDSIKNLEHYIVNIGKVPQEDISELYRNVDALILPTLMESFTSTFVDAMCFGKPIFTSDRDFAKTVCGEAAFYFDPLNPDDIYKTIIAAFENNERIKNKISLGKEIVTKFPDWNQLAEKYIEHLERLSK